MRQRSLKDQLQDVNDRIQPDVVRHLTTDYRLRQMSSALEALPDDAYELFRHFPVSAVATLETYFKSLVAHIIDHDPEFRERGLKLIADKSIKAHEALSIVQSGIATPGQLVAHLLPFSALTHMEGSLDAILGFSIKQQMKTAVSIGALRPPTQNPPLAVQDVSALWQSLTELFEQRHTLAHEAAMGYVVTATQAKAAIDTIGLFMAGMDAVLWATIWKDEPLTNREMTDRAHEGMISARQALADLLREARLHRRLDRHRHVLWRQYFVRYMDGYADDVMGSIRPQLYFSKAADMLRDRIQQLQPREGFMLQG
ncbi:hypothetical protein [Dyella sp. 20L07]|uniref:hypothetical protein n=1 Tax=Dyella sp. 20L07 TaxID=3384240 RepID=UPI003D2C4A1B